MIKSDKWIRRQCTPPVYHNLMSVDELKQLSDFKPMISPFEPNSINKDADGRRILSYGTSSYGYDVTLAPEFLIFSNINHLVIDALDFDESCCVKHTGDFCIIPPNSYALARTNEYFRIPKNVLVICLGKSSLARAAALVNTTPVEPGFEGNVVIEISNCSPLPLKIHANMGIAQFLFFESDEECETSYADRNGKYQGQTGIQIAKV